MRRSLQLAILIGLVAFPSMARAQRGLSRYRNTPAMTPYGPVVNPTQTPEWREAGGNMEVWQQIMMQKAAAKEQAAMAKQQAEYQKALKAQGIKLPTAGANSDGSATLPPVPPRRKKKKATLRPSTSTTAPKSAVAKPKDAEGDEEDSDVEAAKSNLASSAALGVVEAVVSPKGPAVAGQAKVK